MLGTSGAWTLFIFICLVTMLLSLLVYSSVMPLCTVLSSAAPPGVVCVFYLMSLVRPFPLSLRTCV